MSGNQLAAVVIAGLLLVVVIVLFVPARSARTRTGAPSDRQAFSPVDRDDDRRWLGGIIYYNPDDPEPLVPKRYGWGWTINFGHSLGKVFLAVMVALVLLPVILAIFGVNLPAVGCHPSGCHFP